MPLAAVKLVFEGGAEEGEVGFVFAAAVFAAAGEFGEFFGFGEEVGAFFFEFGGAFG